MSTSFGLGAGLGAGLCSLDLMMAFQEDAQCLDGDEGWGPLGTGCLCDVYDVRNLVTH